MTEVQFYGKGLPDIERDYLPGRLIVLEGPDGAGRSTQIALLREWLEAEGYAVASSGFRRSELASVGIAQAKEGHTMGPLTMALFYASDFADRMQREIIPALRAGFVVLTDRYMYTLFARCIVRGVDPDWVRTVMGFALVPDAVLYLRTTISALLPRVLNSRGFDHWESGMDFLGHSDYYESYIEYQTRMLKVFDELSQEYGFQEVDATQDVHAVFSQLRNAVQEVVKELKPPQ